jgi:ABC-type branched-subunit amino acid transport system ATPase component
MQFGGLKALNAIDLAVKPGTIHGLIGPNGSGKSTMMNVLTGIYTPTGGDIRFEGESLVGRNSPEIAARGVARTFQNVQLFGELTCLENVMVGLHHTYRTGFFAVALGLPAARKEERPRANAPPASCNSSGSTPWQMRRRATCPMARCACSRSAARWRSTPSCSCSTSRPRG